MTIMVASCSDVVLLPVVVQAFRASSGTERVRKVGKPCMDNRMRSARGPRKRRGGEEGGWSDKILC